MHLSVELFDLIIQVIDQLSILIFPFSFFELLSDGTHVVEAASRQQVIKLDDTAVIGVEDLNLKRVYNLSEYELSLQALQVSYPGPLILSLFLSVHLVLLLFYFLCLDLPDSWCLFKPLLDPGFLLFFLFLGFSLSLLSSQFLRFLLLNSLPYIKPSFL